MKRAPGWALAASCAVACTSLASRYERGNQALSAPFGIAYSVLMAPILQAALNTCIPPGSASPSPILVVVADIAPSGAASDVDVRPRSEGARCVVRHLSEARFPAPPLAPGEETFPIGLRVDLEKHPP